MTHIAFSGTAARRPVTYNLGILPGFLAANFIRFGPLVNLDSLNISFGNFLENDFCNPPPPKKIADMRRDFKNTSNNLKIFFFHLLKSAETSKKPHDFFFK